MTNLNTTQTNGQAEFWPEVLASLSGSLSKGQYTTHFLGSTATISGNVVTVTLPPSANLAAVENQLQAKVFSAVKSVTKRAMVVRFTQGGGAVAAADEVEAESEPETTPIQTKGFTPLVDSLAIELGLVTAAVYGIVWRFCQMNSRTCYASQQTIAERLGLTRITVNKHLKILEAKSYIRCLTPDAAANGETKVYITTNKLQVMAAMVIEAKPNEGV